MTNEDNILLTPDCHGIEAKRAALDRLLNSEREKAVKECADVAESYSQKCAIFADPKTATRMVANAILTLLKKGDTK